GQRWYHVTMLEAAAGYGVEADARAGTALVGAEDRPFEGSRVRYVQMRGDENGSIARPADPRVVPSIAPTERHAHEPPMDPQGFDEYGHSTPGPPQRDGDTVGVVEV